MPRACGKVNLDQQRRAVLRFAPFRETTDHGTDIPSAQSAPRQSARVPRAYENALGTRRTLAPAEEGAQAPRRPAAQQAPGSLTRERLPRRARLTSERELRAALEQGRRHRCSQLDLIWQPNRVGHPRIAVIVPRLQHTAVARNRLRRRLREILRRDVVPRLPAVDLVVRARPEAYAGSFRELREALRQVDWPDA